MKIAGYVALSGVSIVALYYAYYWARLAIFWLTGGGTEADDYTD